MEFPLLITGGNGRLGTELRRLIPGHYPTRAELDVTNRTQINGLVFESSYAGILHLAAISDPKTADAQRTLSYAVNVLGTRNMARKANEENIPFIYISSDYVFPCTTGGYKEEDAPAPANWYGYTKYAGELEAQLAGGEHLIIRTSFRPKIWSFPTAFSDIITTADYVDVIAQEIATCVALKIRGIIHIGTPAKSFYELAAQRKPQVIPALCTDPTFPRNRTLAISRWLEAKHHARGMVR
jgi:dTDP-4-dehydrorhamnose reductase